jgi:ribonucleoside-diphosphate reductase alpha chain
MSKVRANFLYPFSQEIYESTYPLGDETIETTLARVARGLAEAETEEKKDRVRQDFEDLLSDFKFIPGGRILSNAGANLKGTTLINCFVSGPHEGETDLDSMNFIHIALGRQMNILKSEGGYGANFDFLRPRGAYIKGIAGTSPGAVVMMELWDKSSEVITSGSGVKYTGKKLVKGKIRKGAQMATMSIWHPDIEEFITAKQTPGRLSKFNMSVLITDEFIYAVKNNLSWNLEFPDLDNPNYSSKWLGFLQSPDSLDTWKGMGFPTTIYKTFENANELWDLIMTSTYNRAEPGVLFVDTINRNNNLNYMEKINASNPCGEQMLPSSGGVCLLGSFNLTQFINEDKTGFDLEKLTKYIPIAVRLMDNVNEVSNVPLPIQKEMMLKKRRIGLGVMGYGSALMELRIAYGSTEALRLTEDLENHIANIAYQSSSLLAKEKGSFEFFNKDHYLKHSLFVQKLSNKTRAMIKKYGLRNSHLLSIQPTGNTSIMANNVSGGLEPVFMPEYTRTSIIAYPPEGMISPMVDWTGMKIMNENKNGWKWVKEGDENLLSVVFKNDVYKFDKSRGLLRETHIADYGVLQLQSRGLWDKDAAFAKTTTELSVEDHIETMKIFAKYVDSAISKTVNIPNDYPYEKFKSVYLQAFDNNIKGITTYRSGTMTSVLSAVGSTPTDDKESRVIIENHAPKRPNEIPCQVHKVTSNGEKYVFLVGLLEGKPYEIFSFKEEICPFPESFNSGTLRKEKSKGYQLIVGKFVLDGVVTLGKEDNKEALTRMVSTSLRHGVPIQFLVDQLSKTNDDITSYSKAMGRVLKKYVVDSSGVKCQACGSVNVTIQEGCFVCRDCGSSKCS